MGEASKKHDQPVLTVLEAIKIASKDLQTTSISFTNTSQSAIIKSLLELKNEASSVLSADPSLLKLSRLLNSLKSLLDKLESSQGYGFRSFLRRQLTCYEASRIGSAIMDEIKEWIDRESLKNLVKTMEESGDEGEKIEVLKEFQRRVAQGFEVDLQDLILRTKIFPFIESILCDSQCSIRIREESAAVIACLVKFNKDVFVGLVLMGPIIRALISISSSRSIQILTSLIKLVKSPLIDITESNGEIPKIIGLLSSPDLFLQVAAMDCVLEIGYFGRREAIEATLEDRLIEKLMELQRSENGGDSITEKGNREETETDLRRRRFSSSVSNFAVQLEVGEGLRQREKREFKLEILKRVRESSISETEAATVSSEVLWGSSP